ncbi:hypothetical protein ILUMI_26677 [Ignelater luminosus]|uniref:Uncharacterized protein n=1 Tax=Ignelater luminosus TaxID=2038154 RepID=A0A8K0C639_IGNLU|nr:hypothetical protein ILUMI_26677 [Ignelater luminosus]
MVPSSFKLEVKLLNNPDKASNFPLDRVLLNGYHAVGAFGVLHVQHVSSENLQHLSFDKTEANYILKERDKKSFWNPVYQLAKLLNIPVNDANRDESLKDILNTALMEIHNLQFNNAACIKQKIDLESWKVSLVEKCTKLQSGLSPRQQVVAQQRLDKIVNFGDRLDAVINKTVSKTNTSETNLGTTSRITSLNPPSTSSSSLNASESIEAHNENCPKQQTKSLLNTDFSNMKLKKATLPIPITRRNLKSLLTGQIKSVTNPISSKIMEQKQIIPTSTNAIDSNIKRQKNYANADEKLLIKDFPMKISKEMIELVNQKQKMAPSNISIGQITKTTVANNISNKSSTPSVFTISKKNPTIQASLINNNVTIMPKQNLISIPVANVLSSNKPLTCISTSTLPSFTCEMPKTSMATLTPLIPLSTSKCLPKTVYIKNKNLLTIKEGENVKYIEIFPASKLPVQSVQAIKRPATTTIVQPPTKKAGSSILIANQTQKTDK